LNVIPIIDGKGRRFPDIGYQAVDRGRAIKFYRRTRAVRGLLN